MTKELREIQAHGFAVAYCELMGSIMPGESPDYYLPDIISHKEFSEKTKSRTDSKGMPLAVREYANECKDRFGLHRSEYLKKSEHRQYR